MHRSHLLVAISASALLGCTNEQSTPLGPPIEISDPHPIPVPDVAELSGIVELNGRDQSGLALRLSDGLLIPLVGLNSSSLARVVGAEVWVRGTWETPHWGDRGYVSFVLISGLVVERFQVTVVAGRRVSDGVVEETTDGYALRLQDGSLRALVDASADVFDLLGSRIWITGIDEPPVAFGVIARKSGAT